MSAHADAAFIATFDPDTVRGLLDALDAAEKDRDDLNDVADSHLASFWRAESRLASALEALRPFGELGIPDGAPGAGFIIRREWVDAARAALASTEPEEESER